MDDPKRVAILISGRGSNMAALIDAARLADFPAEIVAVISNRADAAGLERAAASGIPTKVIESKPFGKDRAGFEAVLQPAALDGLVPFQPTVERIFVASDVLRLFGHVYWKDKAQPVATMKLTGPNGTTSVTPQLVAEKPAGGQQDAVIAAMLPIRGMAPGKYHLAISASLPGGKSVSRDVLFEVK